MDKPEIRSVVSNDPRTDRFAQLETVARLWHNADDPFSLLSRKMGHASSIEDILAAFGETLQPWVAFDQLVYRNKIDESRELTLVIGSGGSHSCDYRMNLEGQSYGNLELKRRQRFAEPELTFIEDLLTVVIGPLAKACRYAMMEQAALTDSLTGVPNKRALTEAVRQQGFLQDRHGQQSTLILCDLDHFKNLNDNHGHLIGDLFLKEAAQAISRAIRSSDTVYRFGGEEFAVLLPMTAEGEARLVAERIRESLAGIELECGKTIVRTTGSLGIAARVQGEADAAWITRADAALYDAKRGGRNQVRLSHAIRRA